MNLDQLKTVAGSFRQAILLQDGHLRMITTFPNGACANVSDMLGLYFTERMSIDVEYVRGTHNGQHHAWLTHEDVIIDITADQFPHQPPVTVSSSSAFHDQFNKEPSRRPEIPAFEFPEMVTDWLHDYKVLKRSCSKILDQIAS